MLAVKHGVLWRVGPKSTCGGLRVDASGGSARYQIVRRKVCGEMMFVLLVKHGDVAQGSTKLDEV